MIYLRKLTADQKHTLAEALDALTQYPAGRPVAAFIGALGMSPQAAMPLMKELEAEKFLRIENDRVHAGLNATGGGKVTFSHGTARRKELLAKSPIGKRVLAEERNA